jgi:hypothetical protein
MDLVSAAILGSRNVTRQNKRAYPSASRTAVRVANVPQETFDEAVEERSDGTAELLDELRKQGKL